MYSGTLACLMDSFALFYYSLLTFAFLHLNIHKKYLIAILLVVFIVSLPIQSYVEAYL